MNARNELLRHLRIWSDNVDSLSVDITYGNRRLAIDVNMSAVDIFASLTLLDREQAPLKTALCVQAEDLGDWFRWLAGVGELP